jgi:hypothetical protein
LASAPGNIPQQPPPSPSPLTSIFSLLLCNFIVVRKILARRHLKPKQHNEKKCSFNATKSEVMWRNKLLLVALQFHAGFDEANAVAGQAGKQLVADGGSHGAHNALLLDGPWCERGKVEAKGWVTGKGWKMRRRS